MSEHDPHRTRALLGVATIRYVSPKYGVDARRTLNVIAPLDDHDRPCWQRAEVVTAESVSSAARIWFASEAAPVLANELERWLADAAPLVVWRAPDLDVTSDIDEFESEFVARVAQMRREVETTRLAKIRAKYHAKHSALTTKQRAAATRPEQEAATVANIEHQLALLQAQLTDDIAAIRDAPPTELVRIRIPPRDAEVQLSVIALP